MGFILHIVLPDIVELYSCKNHTFWFIGSGLSGKKFPILICMSCPRYAADADWPVTVCLSPASTDMDELAEIRKGIEGMLLTQVKFVGYVRHV